MSFAKYFLNTQPFNSKSRIYYKLIMKKNIKSLVTLLTLGVIALTFYQCNDIEPAPVSSNTSHSTGKAFLSSNAPVTQNFTKDASTWISITSNNNLNYSIPTNSLYLNGSPVSGNVDIAITEYMSRADMIFGGVTTSTSAELLESDGMFKVSVTQAGQPLTLNGQYYVRVPTDEYDFDMQIFEGEETTNANGDEEITWVEQRDSSWIQGDSGQTGGSGYQLTLDFLDWCNLDKYYNQQPQTMVRLKLPKNYTNTNTTVYMILDDNSVVNLYGDSVNEEFNSGSYTAPVGWDVKFLVVSVIDGNLKYAVKDSKITDPHLETIASLTTISETDLEALIKAL
jgi:hypothetical protein